MSAITDEELKEMERKLTEVFGPPRTDDCDIVSELMNMYDEMSPGRQKQFRRDQKRVLNAAYAADEERQVRAERDDNTTIENRYKVAFYNRNKCR